MIPHPSEFYRKPPASATYRMIDNLVTLSLKRNARGAANVTATIDGDTAQVIFNHSAPDVALPVFMESLGTSDEDFMTGLSVQLARLALKAPGCRYAVLAYATRSPTRRPLEKGERPPQDADINDDGALTFGPAYALKALPRPPESQSN